MIVVLAIRAAVTIARIQRCPLVIGGKAAIIVGQRVVERHSSVDEGDSIQ